MIIMRNFKVSRGYIGEHLIGIATDENGEDWYESQKNFQADSLKIVFNRDGVIISMSQKVAELWPGENSVAEVAAVDVPDGIDINGGWVFDGEKIVPRTYSDAEWQERAEAQRQSLLNAANAATSDWRTELQLDIISDDDKAALTKWMVYIKALKEIDLSSVTDETGYNSIAWPDVPA